MIARRGRPIIAAVTLLAAAGVARRRQLRWGATDAEARRSLTGDDLVADPDLSSTRAITIRAGVEDVWPWVVQLGQGRGGFYSYDGLENLVGCDIHSADTVNPDWQHLEVGDTVRLAPEFALTVAIIEAPRTLVLQGGFLPGLATAPYDFTWTFDLSPVSPTETRLLVRERYSYLQWWARLIIEPVSVISFVMSHRMLHGLRDRAEHRAHRQPLPGSLAPPDNPHPSVPREAAAVTATTNASHEAAAPPTDALPLRRR
jgi:hypothetical protein